MDVTNGSPFAACVPFLVATPGPLPEAGSAARSKTPALTQKPILLAVAEATPGSIAAINAAEATPSMSRFLIDASTSRGRSGRPSAPELQAGDPMPGC
jgi:hypothetical protein